MPLPQGEAHPPGHGDEEDFGKPAAVVVAGAEEQDFLFSALLHRSTSPPVGSFFWQPSHRTTGCGGYFG